MIRDILVLECKLIYEDLSRIDKAILTTQKEEIEEHLEKELNKNKKTITKRIIDMTSDFQKLCFNMSKADGTLSFKEIQSLSVYEFYTLQKNIKELHEASKSMPINTNE